MKQKLSDNPSFFEYVIILVLLVLITLVKTIKVIVSGGDAKQRSDNA